MHKQRSKEQTEATLNKVLHCNAKFFYLNSIQGFGLIAADKGVDHLLNIAIFDVPECLFHRHGVNTRWLQFYGKILPKKKKNSNQPTYCENTKQPFL